MSYEPPTPPPHLLRIRGTLGVSEVTLRRSIPTTAFAVASGSPKPYSSGSRFPKKPAESSGHGTSRNRSPNYRPKYEPNWRGAEKMDAF